jgi:hypothetical protein
MEINLNKNSITAKLYRWFYNVDTLPQNLCPYFWKVVIMYLLLPFLGIPALIGHLIEKDCNAFTKSILTIAVTVFFTAGLIGIGSLIVSPIVVFNWVVLNIKPNDMYGNMMVGGLTGWFSLFIYGFWVGGVELYKYLTNKKTNTPKESNIILAFVKAKYHKYCLPINWN